MAQGQTQANFAVSIDGTNSPITEGESLDVTATIENTGDQSGTQDAILEVGGIQRDATSLSLSAGESQTVTLTWDTSIGDSGDFTATVASEDETTSTSALVLAQENFAVSIDGTNSPITEGESLDVTATIENTGDQSGTQDAILEVGGIQRDATSLSLSAGESQTVTLTWDTSIGDSGDFTATVASEDETTSTSVTIQSENQQPSASFTFDPSTPTVGETLTFDASGSGDLDGTIVEYRWDFDNNGQTEATGQTTSFSFSKVGDKLVTLTVVDDDGATGSATETIEVNNSTGTSIDPAVDVPEEHELSQNYPNPFNPSTVIEYALPEPGNVELIVYNILGREVATLVNDQKQAGHHQVTFDASNLASGLYIYHLQANSYEQSHQMTLIK
ncbi:PKD domain-containing protein [Rhodohalobacter sp. 8-1]|uniref:PKD domain-containing protein n=1 Tax=Rhodohalobacter sp. 8-1 TaxID=3131972 RepID=UPI0030EF3EB1